MLHERFASQYFHANTFDSGGRAGKVLLDERLAQTDRLKDLRALVTLQCRNSHLGERLQKPLVDRLHVTLENLFPSVVRREGAVPEAVFQSLDREIGVHGASAITQQQRKVHHFTRFA